MGGDRQGPRRPYRQLYQEPLEQFYEAQVGRYDSGVRPIHPGHDQVSTTEQVKISEQKGNREPIPPKNHRGGRATEPEAL